jgi:rubrerythrin
MSISNLILTYVLVLLGSLILAAVYSELRRRRFEPEPSEDRIFRCNKCGYVYTDDPDVDRSRCSQCGQTNDAFEF